MMMGVITINEVRLVCTFTNMCSTSAKLFASLSIKDLYFIIKRFYLCFSNLRPSNRRVTIAEEQHTVANTLHFVGVEELGP